jgi:SAM-dependent methyltransferase
MDKPSTDTAFAGSIPAIYESRLVPLIFAPYAEDLARRVAARHPSRVLETAAGTGVVTRAMARLLPAGVEIVATDLNAPMLEHAGATGTARPVEWRQVDAMRLPFDDAAFDVVVCQFGAMFFPDKAVAYAEARRVLRPGGAFVFNVWNRIEENDFPTIVVEVLARRFPADPPRFLARTPHGYFDREAIAADLQRAGYAGPPRIETLTFQSRAASARDVAIAFCQGTPMRGEIEARAPGGLDDATAACAEALAERFGTGAIEGRIQAHVVTIDR